MNKPKKRKLSFVEQLNKNYPKRLIELEIELMNIRERIYKSFLKGVKEPK